MSSVRTRLLILVLLCAAAAGSIYALLSADNDRTRTRIRYTLETVGFPLSNVWTRVDSHRRLLMLGGTCGSTQQVYNLLMYLTNFTLYIDRVQQYFTTPEPLLFPVEFDVGFDPYASNTTVAAP